MDNPKPSSNPTPKPTDKKPPQQGGNFVWYLLGLGVLLLLLVTIFNNHSGQRIDMSDFERLIVASNTEANPAPEDRSIDVEDRSPTPPQKLRLSDLSRIEVGDHVVTARVTRSRLAP